MKIFKPDTVASFSRREFDDKRAHFCAFIFFAGTILLAYSGVLHGTSALDDSIIGYHVNAENVLSFDVGYRKIAYLTFLVNKWIDPLDFFGYRVLNIGIHFVNACLVYVLSFVTLRLSAGQVNYGRYSFPAALISGTVFALHPLNINAVSYIVQRMASLAAMFVLLALLCYVMASVSSSKRRAFLLYAVSFINLSAGILSKENAIIGLPLILLYDYVFFVRTGRRTVKVFAFMTLSIFVAGAALIFCAAQDKIARIAGIFINWNSAIPAEDWVASDVYWTPYQHVLTEFRVIGRYLFLFFFPLPRFSVFDWWGFPVSSGLLRPLTTLISTVILGGGVFFSFYKIKRLPFLSFGVLWYMLALFLESFIAVGSDLYFEHRNYLPLAGLTLGITAQIITSVKPGWIKERHTWVIAFSLSAVLGLLTFQRNLVWKDSVALWEDNLTKTPRNLRAIISLGNAYLRKSDLDKAKEYYKSAVRISESDGRPVFFQNSLYSLGMSYLFTGDLQNAKNVIDLMNSRADNSPLTAILDGYYHSLSGDPGSAIHQYNEVLSRADWMEKAVVYMLLGDAYRAQGMPGQALESYRRAVEINPFFAAAYCGIGETYLEMKDFDKAAFYISKTLELDPAYQMALSGMACILLFTNQPLDKAMAYADKALSTPPLNYQPYVTKANILLVMGKDDAADEFYRKAKELGFEDHLLYFNKANAYFMKGDTGKAGIFLKKAARADTVTEDMRTMIERILMENNY